MAEDEESYHLASVDGTTYIVLGSVAKQSKTLRNLIEDTLSAPSSALAPILVPGIEARTLLRVFTYCGQPEAERTEDWCAAFFEDRTTRECLDILAAANYLDIPALQLLCEKHLTQHFIGMEVSAIRAELGAPAEMTEQARQELNRDPIWKAL